MDIDAIWEHVLCLFRWLLFLLEGYLLSLLLFLQLLGDVFHLGVGRKVREKFSSFMLDKTMLLFHLPDNLETLTRLEVLLEVLARLHEQSHHVLSDISASKINALSSILNRKALANCTRMRQSIAHIKNQPSHQASRVQRQDRLRVEE